MTTVALLMPWSPADAGFEHEQIVTEHPAAGVAQLVATERWPHPRVDALARRGDVIFVGGAFERLVDDVGEHDVPYLAAIDAVTGDVMPFRVPLNRPVQALAVRRGKLYVGGEFTTVGGEPRRALIKVDATTGKVISRFRPELTRGVVRDLGFARGRLVAAGSFPGYLRSFAKDTGRQTRYLSLKVAGKVHRRADPTMVHRFAVSPQQDRIMVVGNFRRVEGELRKRAFMVRLRPRQTRLTNWYYPPLKRACAGRDPYRLVALSDVDFAPDGSYFVVGSTGGAVPVDQPDAIGTAICDAVARFETTIVSPTAPTWINYTGGDTIWSVLSTGAAVYVQGHFRWLDNPEGRNYAGPGAVWRRGIGAVDATTGQALPWDPDKPARRGGRAFLADPRGLWVGSDSERIAGEPHLGLGLLPLPSEPTSTPEPTPTP